MSAFSCSVVVRVCEAGASYLIKSVFFFYKSIRTYSKEYDKRYKTNPMKLRVGQRVQVFYAVNYKVHIS